MTDKGGEQVDVTVDGDAWSVRAEHHHRRGVHPSARQPGAGGAPGCAASRAGCRAGSACASTAWSPSTASPACGPAWPRSGRVMSSRPRMGRASPPTRPAWLGGRRSQGTLEPAPGPKTGLDRCDVAVVGAGPAGLTAAVAAADAGCTVQVLDLGSGQAGSSGAGARPPPTAASTTAGPPSPCCATGSPRSWPAAGSAYRPGHAVFQVEPPHAASTRPAARPRAGRKSRFRVHAVAGDRERDYAGAGRGGRRRHRRLRPAGGLPRLDPARRDHRRGRAAPAQEQRRSPPAAGSSSRAPARSCSRSPPGWSRPAPRSWPSPRPGSPWTTCGTRSAWPPPGASCPRPAATWPG